ncbi:MAG TPA: hypothetical protein PKD19_02895 [Candidatus Saccharibacteria bacterium]|jgi:hypothetical protein|nr:hypothetical protein [Candidatus Saccharibacteria bacterium]HMR38549.1 hypothetical protein [Candidatus Saccharibacteria bacterium]
MLEFGKLVERCVAASILSAIGAISLSGCAPSEQERLATWQEYLEALTPVDRFFTDYVHGDSGDWRVGRTACLRDTPYGGELKDLSVRMSWKKPASRYNKETDTLTITPPSGEPLLLTGFDQYVHPVTPADSTSEGIVEAYGCPLEFLPYSVRR